MRIFLFALTILAAAIASACPGGSVKSLVANGRELAQINMADSSIKITDGSSKITGISTIRSNSYESREQCGQAVACESAELLAIDVTEDPQAIVVVHIREANAVSSQIFKITNFYLARSMNACGQVVEALQ